MPNAALPPLRGLDALADSFAFASCEARRPLRDRLVARLPGVRA